jgi:outer membrane receptor protein involved in Fe transport
MHSRAARYFAVPIVTFLCGVMFSHPVDAALDELFQLKAGGMISQFDTNVRFTSRDGTIDRGIDLEDDVGYNPNVSASVLRGWYRVGDNHRLALTYAPVTRTSFIVSQKDIEIGDDIIKPGAGMAWNTQNRLLDLSYIYSLYHRPDFEFGLSAGIYWLRSETEVLVAGEVQSPNEPAPVFRVEYRNSFKLHAPLPILGIKAEYEINPSWRLNGDLRYLSVTIGEYDGRVFNAAIGTDYFFTESLGVGLALSSFSVDVNVESIVLNGALKWAYNSAQLYVVYKY